MHSTSCSQRVEKGDLVFIEVRSNYNTYQVSASGQFYVGDSPPADIVDTYKLVSDMYKGARNAVKIGASAGDIWEGGNRVYHAIRGEDYYRRMGFSVGLRPLAIDLVKDSQVPINPGTALFIQAQVDKPALISIASSILVTETGVEELTKPLLELKTI